MPEHVHFVMYVTERTRYHLGEMIAHLKSECSRCFAEIGNKSEYEPSIIPVFEAGYHDRILTKAGQLQRMLDYVSDNPRCRLIRMQYPDFFCRYQLPEFEGMKLEAYGNISLLSDPDIEAVKVSSRYTAEELRKRKINWKRAVENCGVLLSPLPLLCFVI